MKLVPYSTRSSINNDIGWTMPQFRHTQFEYMLGQVIRTAKWVGSFPDSLDIQSIGHNEFNRTFHYGLKQIESEDDLNERIDWHHSDLI